METIINIESELILPKNEGLPPQTLSLIHEGFSAFYEEADKWRKAAAGIVVTSPDQKKEIKQARETRLALKDIRVGAEKKRKAMKEDSLRLGKAIDGAYNMLEHAIKPVETYLEEQEKIAERMEAERIAELRETRLGRLRLADSEHIPTVDVAGWTEEQFEAVLSDVRTLKQVRLERQRKEEADRIERERREQEERQRIAAENERLKAEAAQREAEMKAEREAALAREREIFEANRKERLEEQARIEAEREAREKAEAEARKLREEQERKEREAQAERDKAERERINAERKAAAAPDKEKFLEFAQKLRRLESPVATSEDGKSMENEIDKRLFDLVIWIETQAATL